MVMAVVMVEELLANGPIRKRLESSAAQCTQIETDRQTKNG